MADSLWHAFENGATLGQSGSERGVTIRDEEHPLGARITLERDTQPAPYAITCGIYGCMVHTRFFSSEDEAGSQYERMKDALSALLETAERAAGNDEGRQVMMAGINSFVEMFP